MWTTQRLDIIWVILVLCTPMIVAKLGAHWRHHHRISLTALGTLFIGVWGGLTESQPLALLCLTLCLGFILAPKVLLRNALRCAYFGQFQRAHLLITPLYWSNRQWIHMKSACRLLGRAAAMGDDARHALIHRLKSMESPYAAIAYRLCLFHSEQWTALQHSPDMTLRARALCELGRIEEATELAARVWHQRTSLRTLLNKRELALIVLAFNGRLTATEQLITLTRPPKRYAAQWRQLTRRIQSQQNDGTPKLLQHLGVPVGPRPPGSISTQILDRLEGEVNAMFRLRLTPPWSSWGVCIIGLIMVSGFLIQSWVGRTDDARIAYELGALLPDGRLPDTLTRLVSYGCLHFGWTHLLSNLLILVLIGPMVSRRITEPGLGLLWFSGMLIAGIGISLAGARGVTIGASGAAMALFGFLLVYVQTDAALKRTRWGILLGRMLLTLIILEGLMEFYLPMVSSAGHFFGLGWGVLIAICLGLKDRRSRGHPPI
ncbi:MAG: rhomboid family intramembrane serine protease [Myxococcota bacterium]|nr:rhomboid family intramembrane serine protease [Myxococcota bacterium]